MGFIESFMDYTKSYESPDAFWYWSAVGIIGATLRDNCYLLLGDSRTYANLYIIIIANPAMRKAKPLNSVIELAKIVNNTKIIEGRTSIQAVIQRLGELERHKDGRTISGASGLIYSEEISAMFTEDASNIPILGDLWDFKTSYAYTLVSRATTRLTNVVVSMLGASNEELLKPIFNNGAIYGGLLSRCLLVYGDKVRHRNSLMWEDPRQYNPVQLQKMLIDISKLKGLFTMTEGAKVYYDDWYNNTCPQLESKGNRTGAEGRIHTNILKIAMILSANESNSLEIDIPIIERAIAKCQGLFVNYKRFTMGHGRAKDVASKILFLQLLWESGAERKYTLTRKDLIAKSWADITDDELNSSEINLLEGGFIKVVENKTGLKTYCLTQHAIDYFVNRTAKTNPDKNNEKK